MILEKLIAEAWEQERARWTVNTPEGWGLRLDAWPPDAVVDQSPAAMERHLSALCARAVMRALQEAGYGIAMKGAMGNRYCIGDIDIIPAALEQP